MAIQINYNLNISYINKNITLINELKDLDTTLQSEIIKTITIPTAYIKIISDNGDYTVDKDYVFKIGVYKDSTKTTLLDIKQFSITPDVNEDSVNFIKQGYLYLKTLDEYKDAIDC